MNITDELRRYISGPAKSGISHICEKAIANIADRIDAEHEDAIQKALMGEGVVPATDENMAAHGWVRLPKDADGEYIRIGDVMEKPDGYNDRLFTVDGMVLYSDRWTVQGFTPCKLHHYATTVEDVLREFAVEVCGEPALTIRSGVVEEYAAKLRLAGES